MICYMSWSEAHSVSPRGGWLTTSQWKNLHSCLILFKGDGSQEFVHRRLGPAAAKALIMEVTG